MLDCVLTEPPCLSLNPLDCQVTAQQCSSEELITKIMSEPSTWQMRLNPTSPSDFANKNKMTQPNKPIYTTKSTEQVQHTQPIDLKIVNLVLTICNCVFSWARHFNAVRFRDRVDPCLNLRTRCFWICCCRDLFRFAHGAQFSRRVVLLVWRPTTSGPLPPSTSSKLGLINQLVIRV